MTDNDSLVVVEVETDVEDQMLFENYRNDDLSENEGYDIDRFIETPRNDIICPVCIGVVRNPLECVQCGSLLCKNCITRACASAHTYIFQSFLRNLLVTCPICRSKSMPREPSIFLLKYINNLQIACKYRNQGCSEIFCVGDVKEHQKICQFAAISCANQQFCNKRGNKNEFITLNFTEPRYVYFNDERVRQKEKYVCSEICKKVMLMKNALDSGQINESRAMYHKAIEELLS